VPAHHGAIRRGDEACSRAASSAQLVSRSGDLTVSGIGDGGEELKSSPPIANFGSRLPSLVINTPMQSIKPTRSAAASLGDRRRRRLRRRGGGGAGGGGGGTYAGASSAGTRAHGQARRGPLPCHVGSRPSHHVGVVIATKDAEGGMGRDFERQTTTGIEPAPSSLICPLMSR